MGHEAFDNSWCSFLNRTAQLADKKPIKIPTLYYKPTKWVKHILQKILSLLADKTFLWFHVQRDKVSYGVDAHNIIPPAWLMSSHTDWQTVYSCKVEWLLRMI